jgi:uncharacterized protein
MALGSLLFFFQENMIFYPEKLREDYKFSHFENFEEIFIPVEENITLHALLFKAENPKGLIFYLHGNAGSLSSWGHVAQTYTDLDYDVFILDYRGYGKSGGRISSQKILYRDTQAAYDKAKTLYEEENIVVIGYSIGTGMAAKLASTNSPRMLVLQAPFYNLTDLMKHYFPFVPAFLLKYKFETNKYLKDCKMPIAIFHGREDEIIPFSSSEKLKKLLKPSDTFIPLKNQGHNGMTDNPVYLREIGRLLGE